MQMCCVWRSIFCLLSVTVCIDIVTSLSTNNDSFVPEQEASGGGVLTRRKRRIEVPVHVDLDNIQSIPSLATLANLRELCELEENEIAKCELKIQNFRFKFPLFIDAADRSQFIYPDENGYITLESGAQIYLSCGSRPEEVYIQLLPGVAGEFFTCQCKNLFASNNLIYDIRELYCTNYPPDDVRHVSDVTNFRRLQFGYQTSTSNFLSLTDIYYDKTTSMPSYTKSVMPKIPKMTGRQCVKDAKRGFLPSQHDFPDIDTYYKEGSQISSFHLQLKEATASSARNVYLNKKGDKLFNRGHMTPKSSMVYSAGARATFVHVNVVPQWITINSGNWGKIEDHIHDMAVKFGKDLVVITGVYQQLQLKGDDGTMKDMYLYAEQQGSQLVRRIPIPKYTYKLIIEPESKKGVVFVTLNNPFIAKTEGPSYAFCTEPFYNNKQLRDAKQVNAKFPSQWKPNIDPLKGWSFMCYVDDFLRTTQIQLIDSDAHLVRDLLYIEGPRPTITINVNDI